MKFTASNQPIYSGVKCNGSSFSLVEKWWYQINFLGSSSVCSGVCQPLKTWKSLQKITLTYTWTKTLNDHSAGEKTTLHWCNIVLWSNVQCLTGHDIAPGIVANAPNFSMPATKTIPCILTLCIVQSNKASKQVNWCKQCGFR